MVCGRFHSRKLIDIVVVLTIFVSLNPKGVSVAEAQEYPRVELVSPRSGSSVDAELDLTITFRITGGWVDNKIINGSFPCMDALWDNSLKRNLDIFVGQIDQNGTVRFIYYDSEGTVLTISKFKLTKVLANGIECSFNINSNAKWTSFPLTWTSPSAFGGTQWESNTLSYQTTKYFFVGWQWMSTQDKYTSKFEATSLAPKFTFSGIKQGDTIDGPIAYSVNVQLNKELSILNFGSYGCSEPALVSENATSRTFQSKCYFIPYTSNDKGILQIQAFIETTNNRKYTSDVISLNIGETLKLGKPTLEMRARDGEATNSGYGKNTSHYVLFEGRFYLKTESNETPISSQKFTVCLETKCGDFFTAADGSFSYRVENLGTSPKYTLTSSFRGIPITRDNFARDRCFGPSLFVNEKCEGSFVPISYSFTIPEKNPPAPALKLTFSTTNIKNPPKTIKWGKSFNVVIETKGLGGADCEMHFQNPGWPSRKGITTFRLQSGKKTTVTVKPWIRLFASYPLKYVCIPDGWPRTNSDGSISIFDKRVGGTMGNVTIVP